MDFEMPPPPEDDDEDIVRPGKAAVADDPFANRANAFRSKGGNKKLNLASSASSGEAEAGKGFAASAFKAKSFKAPGFRKAAGGSKAAGGGFKRPGAASASASSSSTSFASGPPGGSSAPPSPSPAPTPAASASVPTAPADPGPPGGTAADVSGKGADLNARFAKLRANASPAKSGFRSAGKVKKATPSTQPTAVSSSAPAPPPAPGPPAPGPPGGGNDPFAARANAFRHDGDGAASVLAAQVSRPTANKFKVVATRAPSANFEARGPPPGAAGYVAPAVDPQAALAAAAKTAAKRGQRVHARHVAAAPSYQEKAAVNAGEAHAANLAAKAARQQGQTAMNSMATASNITSSIPRLNRKGPFTRHSQPEQEAILQTIQDAGVFMAPRGGGEVQVTAQDLDMILDEAGSGEAASLYLAQLANEGLRFEKWERLADGITYARKEVEREEASLRKKLGPDWRVEDVNRLMTSTKAGKHLLAYLQQFVTLPSAVTNLEVMINNVCVLMQQEQQKGKQDIVSFLQGPECSLFSGPIALRQSDLTRLINAGGGYPSAVLADMRSLDSLGQSYPSFDHLIQDIGQNQDLQQMKRQVLAAMMRTREELFEDPMISVTMDSVSQLLSIGQGGPCTGPTLELIASTGQRFAAVQDLGEEVRRYSDRRSKAMVREIEKVFAYLSTVNIVQQASVQNSELKTLVEKVFEAHYGVEGGDVTAVLSSLKANGLKFDTMVQLTVSACSSLGAPDAIPGPPDDGFIPGPPEEEQSGFNQPPGGW